MLLLLSNFSNTLVLVWLKRHKSLQFHWVFRILYLFDVQIEQAFIWRLLFRAYVALFVDLWFHLIIYNLILEIQAIILRHFRLRCSYYQFKIILTNRQWLIRRRDRINSLNAARCHLQMLINLFKIIINESNTIILHSSSWKPFKLAFILNVLHIFLYLYFLLQ